MEPEQNKSYADMIADGTIIPRKVDPDSFKPTPQGELTPAAYC